jgi:Zn-dependent protease with chaperone function
MLGRVHDGLSARDRPVSFEVDASTLRIAFDDGSVEHVALARLTRRATKVGLTIVYRDDAPDWRLIIAEPQLPEAILRLPSAGRFRRKTIIAYGVASAALLAGAIGLWAAGDRILDLAAPWVPERLSKSVGQAVAKTIGQDRRCSGADGQAALDRLLVRLRPAEGFAEPVSISVFDIGTVNAFAVTGGQIVVLRGLIDQAEGPDELAGVVAHELTHVQLLHPTKALIRALGLSTLIRAIAGDVGNIANEAILLNGSRNAERAADAGALNLLRAANISPNGLADFFKRMAAKDAKRKAASDTDTLIDRLGSFAATHPGDAERISAIEAAGNAGSATSPATSDDDWKKIRSICDDRH